MSDYSFDFRERYAVFTVFDGKCPWCNAPVLYTSFQVDHIIPERLLDDQLELDRLKAMYNLPNDFNINNYENWVPAHPRCNLEKSGKVFENLLTIKLTLDRCAKGKEQARRIEEILRKEPQKAELLTKVQAAIEANLLNIQELQNFLLKTDMINRPAAK